MKPGYRGRHAPFELGPLVLVAALCAMVTCGCAASGIEGTPIRVASADAPHSQLLGQLALTMLQAQGYQVVDRTDMRSERAVRQAFAAGSIDICWAYTGDTWSTHLDHDIPIASPGMLYQRVRDEDALNGIVWLSPSPHGRSMGILMSSDRADALEIATVTDLADYVRGKDSSVSLLTPESLYDSSTGVRGLERVYGFTFRQDRVLMSDADDRYGRVAQGEVDCVLGHAYESELLGHKLMVLEDDRGFFIYSNLAIGVRSTTLSEYGDLEASLLALAGALDDQAMLDMERQILVQHKEPAQVAEKFLREQHLIGPTPEPKVD